MSLDLTWNGRTARVVTMRDVTEQDVLRNKLEHLNEVLRAIRSVSQLIVTESDPATLIDKTCDLLVETRGYNAAWIGLGDEDTATATCSATGWGADFEAMAHLLQQGRWPVCVSKALARDDGHVVDAPSLACAGCPIADCYGDNVAVVTALRHAGSVYGFFGVSFSSRMRVDQDERDLLLEVAGDIALALHKIQLDRRQHEAEASLAAAVSGGQVGLWSWDLVTNEVSFSTEWKAQIGYADDELADDFKEWESRVHPDDLSATLDRIQRCIREPLEPYEAEFRFRHKNGSYRWIMARARVELGADGQPLVMRGSHIDVTTRREEQEQHQRAQQVAHIGHWELASPNGTPKWSDEIFRIFGLDPKTDPPSFTAHDIIIHPDEWQTLDEAVRAGFERAEPFDLFFRISRGSRHFGWMHAIGTPETNECGQVVKLFGTAQDVTAHKAAEEMLAQNERLLRHITDNMFDVVALTDLEGRFKYASPSHEQLGFDPEQLIGQSIFEQVHEDHRQSIKEMLEEVSRSGKPIRTEVLGVRKDGQPVWLESMAKMVHDEGQAPSLIVSTRDISARKQAVQQLEKSEQRFRALFENSLAPILIADSQGRYLAVNPAAAEMFGYSREKLLTMRVADLVTPMPESAKAQFEQYQEHPTARGEFVFVRGDGQQRRALWAAAEIVEGQHASVLQDITDLRRYETRLSEEKERAQRYLDVAAVMLVGLDPEGRINLINAKGCEVLEIPTSAEVLGQDWLQFIPDDSRDAVREMHRANMSGHELHERVEGEVLTAAGNSKRVVWHNAVVRNAQDEIVGSLSSGEDVTERRGMEAQLAQADRLSSMGMLAAGVAHEINNPLSYVLYNLESLTGVLPELLAAMRTYMARVCGRFGAGVIEETVGDAAPRMNPAILDDIQECFRDALSGTQRIRGIARGLGTFSRVEQDQLVPVNLMHVIEAALNMCFNEIRYRACVVKDYGKIPTVMASEGRLAQVFLNLLVNASHAIVEGDVENNQIRVRTWVEDAVVCAEVRDTGEGITPELLGRLFEPFFTTKEIGTGSGLGLPISKNIIEGYGGTISAESEVGKGSTFQVRLPVGAKEVAVAPVGATAEAEDQIRGRILIVDDEDGIRAAMVRMLRGHETVEAASGDEAKRLLAEDRAFDLILCDMMMPKVSGMDLHAWLLEEHPQLAEQLIFITGGAFTPRAREYLKTIGNLRLEKPFDVTNFKKIVSDQIIVSKSQSRS